MFRGSPSLPRGSALSAVTAKSPGQVMGNASLPSAPPAAMPGTLYQRGPQYRGGHNEHIRAVAAAQTFDPVAVMTQLRMAVTKGAGRHTTRRAASTPCGSPGVPPPGQGDASGAFLRLLKQFQAADVDGSGDLDVSEFAAVLAHYHIAVEPRWYGALHAHVDGDADGFLDYMELLKGVGAELTPQREAMASGVFQNLCALNGFRDAAAAGPVATVGTGDGGKAHITLNRLVAAYQPLAAVDVAEGMVLPDAASKDFSEIMRDLAGGRGHVHWAVFQAYYACVSAGIDDDGVFEQLMKESWPSVSGVHVV